MAEDTKVDSNGKRYFALYKCIPSHKKDEDDESSPETTNEQANQSNWLTIVCTDLPASVDTDLRNFLSQKLKKGTVYSDEGIVSTFHFKEDEHRSNFSCYYASIENENELQLSVNSDFSEQKYVIAFLSSEQNALDHFKSELDTYSRGVFSFLDSDVANSSGDGEFSELSKLDTVKQYLEKWFEDATDYVYRCVKLFDSNIKYLLYAALTEAKVTLEGATEKQREDVEKLMVVCSAKDLLHKHGPETTASMESKDFLLDVGEITDKQENTLKIKIENGEIAVQGKSNQFCEDWSAKILKVSKNSSFCKQSFEAFKLNYIQSINTLKRLLIQAESDFYALYRSFVFVKKSLNSDVLMEYSHLDKLSEIRGSFSALQTFVKELRKSGEMDLTEPQPPQSKEHKK